MPRVQISFDDVKGFFKYLVAHPDVESIFHTRFLGLLGELHEEYGTEFTLFCMCNSGEFSLHQVPDKYRGEFMAHADWLHLGFHAWDENSDYQNATKEQMIAEYEETMRELTRITGINIFSDLIRLHGFSGSREACRALKTKGVNKLLTADDGRVSYYLTEEECEEVCRKGGLKELSEGMEFYPSVQRLELCENPVQQLDMALEKGWQIISVFTHEWQMDEPCVQERLRECCRWEQKQRCRRGEC